MFAGGAQECADPCQNYNNVIWCFLFKEIPFLGFQITIHECASMCKGILHIRCAPFVAFHAKTKFTRSGAFYLREKHLGFEITIHECASVCKRILHIRCAAFFECHAKTKFTRPGAFCLGKNDCES